MSRFLRHSHNNRCFVVKKNSDTGSTELISICKVANNWRITKASGKHCFVPLDPQHTQEAIKVMIDIGVAANKTASRGMLQEGTLYEFVPLLRTLQPHQHIPPCQGNDGIISPVLHALVAINPNSDNCQMVSSYFVARYLAKYIVHIDECSTVKIRAPQSEGSAAEYPTQPTKLLNTKITSNRQAQKADLGRGHNPKIKNALGINVTQVYMMLFDYQSVYTNLQHVRYSTDSNGNWAARERKRKPIDYLVAKYETLQNVALTPLNTAPAHHAQEVCGGLQVWRHFTSTQVMKAFDDLHSPLCPDPGVTRFGFRPPELCFVMHQSRYHRWFMESQPYRTIHFNNGTMRRVPVGTLPEQINFCTSSLDSSVFLVRTAWINLATKTVRLRAAAIDELLLYLHAAPLYTFAPVTAIAEQAKQQTIALFCHIKASIVFMTSGELPNDVLSISQVIAWYTLTADTFVCELNISRLPNPWTHSVNPSQSHCFLIHLLLKFGCFTDEYALFNQGNL
jgi:hypothetical protein